MLSRLVLLGLTVFLISCSEADNNFDNQPVAWAQLEGNIEILIPAWDGQIDMRPDYYSTMGVPQTEGQDHFSAFLALSLSLIHI